MLRLAEAMLLLSEHSEVMYLRVNTVQSMTQYIWEVFLVVIHNSASLKIALMLLCEVEMNITTCI